MEPKQIAKRDIGDKFNDHVASTIYLFFCGSNSQPRPWYDVMERQRASLVVLVHVALIPSVISLQTHEKGHDQRMGIESRQVYDSLAIKLRHYSVRESDV